MKYRIVYDYNGRYEIQEKILCFWFNIVPAKCYNTDTLEEARKNLNEYIHNYSNKGKVVEYWGGLTQR